MMNGRWSRWVVGLALVGVLIPSMAMSQPLEGPDEDEIEETEMPLETSLELGAQVFAGWHHQWREDDRFNAWELDRAELHGGWTASTFGEGQVGLVLITEVVRSAGERGFFGVDGDSLVVRGKQAFGHGRWHLGDLVLKGRAGLIPDLWVEALESEYGLRGLSPTLAERGQFFDTSDLGAAALASFWGERITLGLSLTNGQGRTQREQNRGKNLSGLLSAKLLRFDDSGGLTLYVGAREGSVGVASAANHRLTLGTTITHARVGAGAEGVMAYGYGGRGDRQALGVGLWGWTVPITRGPGLALRLDRTDPDLSVDETERTRVQGALFYDLLHRPAQSPRRLRIYAGYSRRWVANASGPLPGVTEASAQQELYLRLEVSLAEYFSNFLE